MIKTQLDYESGMKFLPDGVFKISPSSFNTFMTKPHVWYREQVLGEDGFKGNTASVIGTIVHYIAEMYAKGLAVDMDEIGQYITNQKDNPDVDTAVVRSSYKAMAEVLINDYVRKNMPTEVEKFYSVDLGGGVYVGGSIDAIDGITDSIIDSSSCVVDYKTYNSKTKPRAIPQYYKYQLLIYAYILQKNGYDIDRVRLVYVNRNIDGGISEKTNKKLKSYPPEVTVLTEVIVKEDMEFIESVLFLCRDTYLKAKEDKSLVYLLYKDWRLK